MENPQTSSQIGRRDVIKKAAVAGGIAWTAPMIISSKVGATVGTCPDVDPCTTFYVVKIDGNGSACEGTVSATGQGWSCGRALRDELGFVSLANGCGLYNGGSITEDSATLNFPIDVKILGVKWKGGQECYGNFTLAGQCQNVVKITRQAGQKGISNVSVIFCK